MLAGTRENIHLFYLQYGTDHSHHLWLMSQLNHSDVLAKQDFVIFLKNHLKWDKEQRERVNNCYTNAVTACHAWGFHGRDFCRQTDKGLGAQ